MLAYSIKPILELIPEALPFVKSASLEESFPVDSRDSTLASALAVAYASEVTGKSVDPSVMDKVASAVTLYSLQSSLASFRKDLVKRAHARTLDSFKDPKAEYLAKEAGFSEPTVESKASRATELYKQAQALGVTPSETIQRYSGNLYLDKKAAVEALSARFHLTKDTGFAKLACAIADLDESRVKPQTVQDLCATVTGMDKKAGLHFTGLDFYKEALITKQAAVSALNIKLCGKLVPYEKIERAGRARVAQYIGEDVAKEMDAGPENAKAVFETLPLDLQTLLVKVIDNA
jgi:hypothetical protein